MVNENEAIKLSICIPVYKGLETLKKQLSFFESHMIQGVEVIVSDDASQDDTGDYIENYSKKHKWMKAHINMENEGCDNNIRRLLTLSNGKYVFFLGDDYLADEFLEYIVHIIDLYEPDLIHLNYGCYRDGIYKYKACEKEYKTYFEVKYKKYCNKPIRLNDVIIKNIMENQISHFMFMSSNVFLKEAIKKCEGMTYDYSTILLFSLCAMKNGILFFGTKEYVFSDPTITWSEKRYDVWFYWIPMILKASIVFGYEKRHIQKMIDAHISQCIVSKNKKWKSMLNYLKTNKLLYLLSFGSLLLALKYKIQLLGRKIRLIMKKRLGDK